MLGACTRAFVVCTQVVPGISVDRAFFNVFETYFFPVRIAVHEPFVQTVSTAVMRVPDTSPLLPNFSGWKKNIIDIWSAMMV